MSTDFKLMCFSKAFAFCMDRLGACAALRCRTGKTDARGKMSFYSVRAARSVIDGGYLL
jgi:hypothetical protein